MNHYFLGEILLTIETIKPTYICGLGQTGKCSESLAKCERHLFKFSGNSVSVK